MSPLPFKVEWSGQFPSARKVRHRLHPLISQTDAYSRVLRAGEILLILPSCILIALVVVQALAGNPGKPRTRVSQLASTNAPAEPTLVTVVAAPRTPLLNIVAQRP